MAIDGAILSVGGAATMLALLWALQNCVSGPSFHEAAAVTGCGELVVGQVTVALWGVEVHDCEGANAALQAEVVDAEQRFNVRRGPCYLIEPEAGPRWSCSADDPLAMPEREPLRSGPLGAARVEALVQRYGHPCGPHNSG